MSRQWGNGGAKKGFTIVELTLVVAVIGVLVAITIVSYSAVRQNALNQVVRADLQKAISALNKFKAENGMYPSVFSQLNYQPGSGVSYQYRYVATNDSYCVTASSRDADFNAVNGTRDLRAGGCAGHGLSGQPPITNLVLNPSVEESLANITSYYSPVFTRVSGGAVSGTYFLQAVTNSTVNRQGPVYTITRTPKPNTAYSCSVSVKGTDGTVVAISGRLTKPDGSWLTEGIGQKTVTLGAEWQRVTLTITTPGSPMGTLSLQIITNTPQSGRTIQVDAVMCTEGTTQYKYADGSSPSWAWNGAAGYASSSGPVLK